MAQRLSSAVSERGPARGTVQIGVTSAPGLKGKTLVAEAVSGDARRATPARTCCSWSAAGVPRRAAAGAHLHLSNLERSVDGVRRAFRLPAEKPVELDLGIDRARRPNSTAPDLRSGHRLRADFRFQVFDLGSEPSASRPRPATSRTC